MFQDFDSSGKHMICDFKDIKNTDLLNNCGELKKILKSICHLHNFQILSENEHIFEPIGCSIVFLLSESHLSLHTFPEKHHMSFDIYTCRQYEDNEVYNEIFNLLKNNLNACNIKSNCKIIDRFF
jgi:S-adenosylmethionine decarboxylase proenzyme